MTTARELIRRSLQLIEVVGQGEEVQPDDATDALAALNDLLDSWSADDVAIFQETKESFSLSGGQASYTIGAGGDFDTVRPIKIVSAFTRDANVDYPIRLIDQKDYARITQKNISSSYPSYLYYDANFPLANIYLYSVPSSSVTLHLYSMKPLSTITSLDTVINMPPGYNRALRYNLACEMASEYGKPVPNSVYEIAQESKYNIDNATRKNDYDLLTADPALLRGETYNIYGGE